MFEFLLEIILNIFLANFDIFTTSFWDNTSPSKNKGRILSAQSWNECNIGFFTHKFAETTIAYQSCTHFGLGM